MTANFDFAPFFFDFAVFIQDIVNPKYTPIMRHNIGSKPFFQTLLLFDGITNLFSNSFIRKQQITPVNPIGRTKQRKSDKV